MLILFGTIYWAVSVHVEEQIKLFIESKTKLMVHEAEADGVESLAHMISKIEPVSRVSKFLLLDPKGRRLAGSLPGIEAAEGWTKIRLADGDSENGNNRQRAMLVLGTLLPDKRTLLFVGQSTSQLDQLQAFISTAFIWSALATLGLAISYGLVTGLAFLRRVELVNMAAARIVAGNLTNRVPVRGTNDEFDQLSRNLNQMLDRIAHLIDGLRQVSNDIAHDLRTPLTRLRQGLEATRAKEGSIGAYQSAIERALEQTDEILSTFSALLRIAQIDAGVSTTELRDIDLSEVFVRIQSAYVSVAEEEGKSLVGRIAPGIVIRGDRELLTQMLANLVENALFHTPPGTTVRLELVNEKDGLVGTVADNGPGIPEDARDKVFQRFFRLDQSRSTAGSGLGLSLVAAIARLHGIAITLKDNYPGLRVVLAFPLLGPD
jgi:signal transduction histidine kinase